MEEKQTGELDTTTMDKCESCHYIGNYVWYKGVATVHGNKIPFEGHTYNDGTYPVEHLVKEACKNVCEFDGDIAEFEGDAYCPICGSSQIYPLQSKNENMDTVINKMEENNVIDIKNRQLAKSGLVMKFKNKTVKITIGPKQKERVSSIESPPEVKEVFEMFTFVGMIEATLMGIMTSEAFKRTNNLFFITNGTDIDIFDSKYSVYLGKIRFVGIEGCEEDKCPMLSDGTDVDENIHVELFICNQIPVDLVFLDCKQYSAVELMSHISSGIGIVIADPLGFLPADEVMCKKLAGLPDMSEITTK